MSDNRTEYGFAALALSFVTGALVGATMGVLFAPRSGVETREKIREQADEACTKIREATQTILERAEELADAGKEKWTEAKGKVHESVEKMKDGIAKKEDTGAEA